MAGIREETFEDLLPLLRPEMQSTGESMGLVVQPMADAHVYCYLRDEASKVQRFYPNRFARDSLVVNPAKACQPLGAVFVAIGYFISAIVRDRGLAGGLAIGVWLLFVLIYLAIGHYTLGYFEVRARKSATLALR